MSYRSEPLENGDRVKHNDLLDGLLESAKPAKSSIRKARPIGNIFIALVAWLVGFYFTKTILPFKDIGPYLPWIVAFIIQLALSVGQTNMRDGRAHWPYVALVLIDVGLNLVGLVMQFGLAENSQSAVSYLLRAATGGPGLWQVLGSLFLAALIAALPEQLIRDM